MASPPVVVKPLPPVFKPARGAVFISILGVALFGRLFSIAGGLLAMQAVSQLGGTSSAIHTAKRLLITLVIVAAAQLLCLVGIWGWKKWGVYGYIVTSLITIVAGVKFGASIVQLAGTFVGALLMLAATLPRWRYYDED